MTHLAEQLDIHSSTATRLCDRLVRKGLIHRVEGSADRRETAISLSPDGRRLVDRVSRRRHRDILVIAKKMTASQRRDAIAGLNAFAEAAGEIPEASLFGWEPPAVASG